MEPTVAKWLLVAFGVITLTPAVVIYGIFLRDPHARWPWPTRLCVSVGSSSICDKEVV